MALENGDVDFGQRFLRWEGDVEHTEEGDEARIHFITTTTGLKCKITHNGETRTGAQTKLRAKNVCIYPGYQYGCFLLGMVKDGAY